MPKRTTLKKQKPSLRLYELSTAPDEHNGAVPDAGPATDTIADPVTQVRPEDGDATTETDAQQPADGGDVSEACATLAAEPADDQPAGKGDGSVDAADEPQAAEDRNERAAGAGYDAADEVPGKGKDGQENGQPPTTRRTLPGCSGVIPSSRMTNAA